MTYAIAAAGTGGHVFPGLAVGEALVASGVSADSVLFVGGSRLEARVYPEAGFPFLEVDMRGLQRRLTIANLKLPGRVVRGGPPHHCGIQVTPSHSRPGNGRLCVGASGNRGSSEPRPAHDS